MRIIFFTMVSLALSGQAVFAEETNVMCPVLGDRLADAEIVTVYKGKEIRFCCNECVVEFEENPEIYVSEIPQLQNLSLRERVSALFDTNTRFIVIGALVLLLVGLQVAKWLRPKPEGVKPSLLNRRMPVAIPLAIGCIILGYETWSLRQEKFMTWMDDNMHFATFYDFGYPPSPARPPVEEKRLEASFYRGNDERSPKLFNNGNYRTARFDVSLCDADGNTIRHGDPVAEQMFVRLVIDRPPFTPDFLYDKSVMSKMFLTAECDRFLGMKAPVADRVDLTEIEPMQKWEARFPIDRPCCESSRKGVIYICEEYYYDSNWWSDSKSRGGSRFHYGIRYELETDGDGKVAATSDMWMGALYRTRKFPKWKVPMTEWFSHIEIPELPGPNVEDIELLGIDDHLTKNH
jgi:YHS domain-containing protein